MPVARRRSTRSRSSSVSIRCVRERLDCRWRDDGGFHSLREAAEARPEEEFRIPISERSAAPREEAAEMYRSRSAPLSRARPIGGLRAVLIGGLPPRACVRACVRDARRV